MRLEELYEILEAEKRGGSLSVGPEICQGAFIRLFLAVGIVTLEDCVITLQSERVVIKGRAPVQNWNHGEYFSAEIVCREQEKERIEYQVTFWCDLKGTLQDFFGNVGPTLIWDERGRREESYLAADFPIFMPVLSFDSAAYDSYFPLTFSAKTEMPSERHWEKYGNSLTGIQSVGGVVNKEGKFKLDIPLLKLVSGLFPCGRMSLLLQNGGEYEESFDYSVISEAGLKIILTLPRVSQVEFTLPLFSASRQWDLHTYFPDGFGIADIVGFFMDVFGIGGSAASLCLPTDLPLNEFKLYRMDLVADQKDLSLTMRRLLIEFALSQPWKLPVPYVTLEHLNVGFQVSLGKTGSLGNMLTASVAGGLSIALGRYSLLMDLEMNLPSLDFVAQARLEGKSASGPGIRDLAETFGAQFPVSWKTDENLLGQVTVYGSGSSREFSIEAEVGNILSFSIGNLPVNISRIAAGARAATFHHSFYFQGEMEFGEGEDFFSIFLKAVYENPGWIFEGGLYRGEVKIGNLLSQMFGVSQTPDDIFSLKLSVLNVSYATQRGIFLVSAAFEAGWNITILQKKLTLGGRILVEKQEKTETDVSALAYMSLGSFKILVQIDHIQTKENRNFLFRVEYEKVYLKAAWFWREQHEILCISLGGMTLGDLVESLVNMINPNKKFSLDAPWNLLNKIDLARFLFELDATDNQAWFLYQAELDIAGLMYIDKLGVRYDMNTRKIFFVLTGKMLGVTYDENNPVTWDAIDGQPPRESAENEKKFVLDYLGMGQHLKNDGISEADSITEAVQSLKDQITPPKEPGLLPGDVSYDGESKWLFGADFTINEMLNIKIVLNDPVLYGILATVKAKPGSAMASFDGFGIELLYKRVTSEVYMFRGEMIVPQKYRSFQLGVISLTLGTIRVEVYTNGGFYVDLGFPHNLDFSNSFVLQWSIFTGRGGVFFGVLKDITRPNLPSVVNGNFSPIVVLGLGLSVGLGRSFDLGIVKGGVSLEVFGIFEGVAAVFHEKDTGKEDTYYYVKAVAGVAGRLFLSVDFKIITIQASAEVSAWAALTLQAYKKTLVEVDLSLKLQASIKILFIKIKFSFSFHQHVTFTMGEDRPATWIEEGDNRMLQPVQSRRMTGRLQVRQIEERVVHLEIVPMFYIQEPSLNGEQKYGAAFLMMMDIEGLSRLTSLLTEWILSHFPGDSVDSHEAYGLSMELADTMTYEVLEGFLGKNLSVTYDICRLEESGLQDEREGYIFPMLPSLALTFGSEGHEKTVRYWEEILVDENYFNEMTRYFTQLNPDPSYKKDGRRETGTTDGTMPVAKAFFQDYFRMFLREIIGRIHDIYQQCSTEKGILETSEEFQVSVSDLLYQNQNLVFSDGKILRFPSLEYNVKDGDTLEDIRRRYGADINEIWESVKHVTFLLQQGSGILFGEGTFDNSVAQLSLEEVAAVIFVRFYEEYIPEDMFYAQEVLNMNPGLAMDWEETAYGGRKLNLPGRERGYYTLCGDTPVRIGQYLSLFHAERGEWQKWDDFYDDICNRNPKEEYHPEVHFYVPEVIVCRDLDLAGLCARLYPDSKEGSGLQNKILQARILKANTPVIIPNAVYHTAGTVTVSQVLEELPCTLIELEQAVSENGVLKPGQRIQVKEAALIKKEEIERQIGEQASVVGSMLSRFLLQGLKVLDPCAQNRVGERLVPLYQALGQQFAIENKDVALKVASLEPDCTWVEQGEKQITMLWEEIAKKLPAGDFSALPKAFIQMEDFLVSPQYFTISKTASYYRGQEVFTIQKFSEAMEEVLHTGKSAPQLRDEEGIQKSAMWGCLIPLEIGLCQEEGIFNVYGADAGKRLILHELLGLTGAELHFMYQASEVSKGEQNFQEYEWSAEESFLAKTNLSVETHMEPLGVLSEAGTGSYTADLTQPKDMLRLLWECSTVGGGGYYFRLKTADNGTLPRDIFNEDGGGTLWLLVECMEYSPIAAYVNCAVTRVSSGKKKTLTLMTTDLEQQIMIPRFPVGCIGLSTDASVPPEEDTPEAYMRRLYQIVGYQLREVSGRYEGSNLSAPIVPGEENGRWIYRPVVPVYRYISGKGQENPYLAVGKPGKIALEVRDVLGNSLEMGETGFVPSYNDVLIGTGQWAGAGLSYEITGTVESPILRLFFETSFDEKWGEELAQFQRKAFWQLQCEDIEVELDSPVNDASYRFSELKQGDKTYLELLREYADALACYLEGEEIPKPETWHLDFLLDLDKYPLPDSIFKLKAILTVKRDAGLAKEPAVREGSSVVWPRCEESSISFCEEASRVLPGLLFARKAQGDSEFYGITYGRDGFLKELGIQNFTYYYGKNQENKVEAPEFYALRPLYPGLLSRRAKVRSLLGDKTFDILFTNRDISDVDMEIWAVSFLEDLESLLLPELVLRAGLLCRDSMNRLVEAKGRLAEAIAEQVMPLRQEGRPGGTELKKNVADRLKRSLKDGYLMDVIAGFHLTMKAKEHCRLTAMTKEGLTDTQVTMGKADTSKEEIYLFFTNSFRGKSIPLTADILMPELEYHIEKDGGYESSEWLKFVTPIELPVPKDRKHLLESDIDLPNPLKSCPQPPVLERHSCRIGFSESEIDRGRKLEHMSVRAGWDYSLSLRYLWREQDTLFIRVVFESLSTLKYALLEQDLFDVLAEYSLVKEALWDGLKSPNEILYGNAYTSFAELAEHAAGVWKEWLEGGAQILNGDNPAGGQAYSCSVRGTMTPSGFQLRLESSEEGLEFLEKMHIQTPLLEIEGEESSGETEIRFVMKCLPLYQCVQAEPQVRIVRNQNLLFDKTRGKYLPVCEEFIYRTPFVSIPALGVSGEYTGEYLLGTVESEAITQSHMERAVSLLFDALQLENEYLTVVLSVSYYYGLDKGKEQPRILLPVTLLPMTETTDESGRSRIFIENLGADLYFWYKEEKPVTNCCGLLFDLKVYQRNGERQILHFSNLNVKFILRSDFKVSATLLE